MEELKLPSPLERLHLKSFPNQEVWVKRDDKIHPIISGNKWRKLKKQFDRVTTKDIDGILTYGGAFSNHIVATAEACRLMGIKSIGIIRGEESAKDNPSLRKAISSGMQLYFVTRKEYRLKEDATSIENIIKKYPTYLVLNEGGYGNDALSGVAESYNEIIEDLGRIPDYLICSVGTGTSFAGFSKVSDSKLLGINALKSKGVEDDILKLLGYPELKEGHEIIHNYHFGGYAKYTVELIKYMHELNKDYGIPTDVVYTGKLFYGVFDLLSKGYFKKSSTIVVYHSGGLQGNEGMNYRYPGLINY